MTLLSLQDIVSLLRGDKHEKTSYEPFFAKIDVKVSSNQQQVVQEERAAQVTLYRAHLVEADDFFDHGPVSQLYMRLMPKPQK